LAAAASIFCVALGLGQAPTVFPEMSSFRQREVSLIIASASLPADFASLLEHLASGFDTAEAEDTAAQATRPRAIPTVSGNRVLSNIGSPLLLV
jgi:hypothetical protein